MTLTLAFTLLENKIDPIEYGIEKLLRYLQKTLAVLLLPRLVLDSTANQQYLINY